MAVIQYSARWTRQPQGPGPVAAGSAIARNLEFAHNGAVWGRELARNRKASAIGTVLTVIGPKGRSSAAGTTGSTFWGRDPSLEPTDAQGMTCLVFARRTGTLGNFARIFNKTNSDGGGQPYISWGFEANTSGEGQNLVRWITNTGAFSLQRSAAINLVDATIPFMLVGTRQSSSMETWLNGTLVDTVASSGALSYDTTATGNVLVSGWSSAAAGGTFLGDVYLAAFWSRKLANDEIKSLYVNPWQIFAPIQREIWTGPTVAIGGASNAPRYFHRTQAGQA
jgi:hypothetical protein